MTRIKLMGLNKFMLLASVSVLPLLAAPAMAQTADAMETVVVTGTQIRGIAAVGTQAIKLDTEEIAAIAPPSTTDLVLQTPQINNFGGKAMNVGGLGSSLSVNRPMLRFLGGNSAGGSATLMLVNGHRMPGMGILQNSPDMDSVAPGAIERMEIITDGGSSLYGADAVGGVINFITKKKLRWRCNTGALRHC